ncbi:MAG: metal-dependent hydrolase [Cyanobacteria bacterium P01_H01_bin.150]
MMALTHGIIAAAGTTFFLGDSSPLILGLSILGSQLPDLDTSTSLIGQIFFPISRWIEKRYPHRSLTHSFLATIAIAVCSIPLWQLGWKYWAVLPMAHLITCFADTFTKQGVQLFFPAPVWCVCGSNPNRRITTGGTSEYWIVAAAMALLVVAINITNTGGLELKVTQLLGLKEGTQRVYNQSAGNNHVWVQIEGARTSDRLPINKRYFVLDQSGASYVVMDGEGIYKTGEQIIATKTSIQIGDKATTQTQQLTFDDESPIDVLQQLQQQHPNSLIVLTGQLMVDMPEDIKPINDVNKFTTLKLSGDSMNLELAPLQTAQQQLKEQYVTGSVTAKIINPKPKF